MKTNRFTTNAALLVIIGAATVAAPAQNPKEGFSLTGAVPNDVFLCVAQRHNPEREFLDKYWGEVFDALAQAGLGRDVLDLIGSVLGTEHAAEAERLKEQASQLLDGVNWEQLCGREFVFAERFSLPSVEAVEGPQIGMPDMVWVFRGSAGGAAQNYAGLVAILNAVVAEINTHVGSDALRVAQTERAGARLASVNLLAMAPGAPALPISVALHDDVVVVAVREQLQSDVLDLLGGRGAKPALAKDPRFQKAFGQLPVAEDGLTFFDMQAMLKPLRRFFSLVVEEAGVPGDVYRNTEMRSEVNKLNNQALSAYQRGDIKRALELVQQAYEAAPENAIILYNLACFHALAGHKDDALAWLEKAVDGGFCAPMKIAGDSDLDSLREEPRYKAALAKAGARAAELLAEDVVINSNKTGEAGSLMAQAWQVYQQKDYEQGLKLMEQAYAVAPNDSRVLYSLACFHALLGHQSKALDFLEKAVAGGFYCPRHMSKDPDLESLRGQPRYQAAVKMAREKAAQQGASKSDHEVHSARQILDRITDAVGVMDYIAAVENTDGFTTKTESLARLVADAPSKPIYPVLATKKSLTEFDRFLPQETASFSVSAGMDLRALYKFLEDTLQQLGSGEDGPLAVWAEIQESLGVDIQKDLLAWIDGEFISVTLADDAGSVWLLKVSDEAMAREKVGAAVEFFATKLGELMAENPILAGLAMLSVRTSPLDRADLPGFENLHFTLSPTPAVWGVARGYLVVGTSADATALCLATARGEHPGVRSNARVASEALLPTGPFLSVSLTDQRTLGEELAKGIGIASMVAGMAGAFIPQPEVRIVVGKVAGMLSKLTPVVRKIDFYKSTASLTTFDGQQWLTRTVTHYASPAERGKKSVSQPTR